MSESFNHNALKIKALEFLYTYRNCKYVGVEVAIGKYIYDVVGTDGRRVYIIEAKQSKSDFLRDCNDPDHIRQSILKNKKLLKENGDTDLLLEIAKERAKSHKFYDKSIWKMSTECFVIAPEGMLDVGEIPEGWGLVDEYFHITKSVEKRATDERWSRLVLNTIAAKQTRYYLESKLGVSFGKLTVFPEILLEKNDEI
jgi:hypothetical protein